MFRILCVTMLSVGSLLVCLMASMLQPFDKPDENQQLGKVLQMLSSSKEFEIFSVESNDEKMKYDFLVCKPSDSVYAVFFCPSNELVDDPVDRDKPIDEVVKEIKEEVELQELKTMKGFLVLQTHVLMKKLR